MSPHGLSILPSVGKNSGGLPSADGLRELAAPRWHSPPITRRPVVSYTTFSPLPRTPRGGHSLLPYPAVTDSFYFRKWDALRCPDFPPAPQTDAGDRPERCFHRTKVHQIGGNAKQIALFLRCEYASNTIQTGLSNASYTVSKRALPTIRLLLEQVVYLLYLVLVEPFRKPLLSLLLYLRLDIGPYFLQDIYQNGQVIGKSDDGYRIGNDI